MQNKRIDIIILKGAPGSGKSQTAKSLSQFFPNGVRMEVDTLRQMVIAVDWKNQAEHINILQASTGLVYDFIKLGFSPVIVVDTFSGNKIKEYLKRVYELDNTLSVKIFALFTTEEELKKRLELRPNEEFKDFGISKKLNEDTIKHKDGNEVQIDTTGLLPIETANSIYSQVNIEKYEDHQ